jgi:mxaK protein
MTLRRAGIPLVILLALSLLCAAYEAFRLSQARSFNRLMADGSDAVALQALPEAQFAHARSLAVRDDYEGAVRAYKALSRTAEGPLLEATLYNLGNLHLREALRYGPDEIGRSLPLAELAKTSFRELLQRNPGHWDAKYNLERALRLAPEYDDARIDTPPLPQDSERAVTTMQAFTLGLP